MRRVYWLLVLSTPFRGRAIPFHFVIRLKLGDKRRPVRFVDTDGQPVKLFVKPGQKVIYRDVFSWEWSR